MKQEIKHKIQVKVLKFLKRAIIPFLLFLIFLFLSFRESFNQILSKPETPLESHYFLEISGGAECPEKSGIYDFNSMGEAEAFLKESFGKKQELKERAVKIVLDDSCKRLTLQRMDMGKLITLGIPADLNSLSLEELQKLPGIGPSIAQKILDYRKEKGNLKSLKEILEVDGIGPKKFEMIKPYVFINK